MLRWWPYLVVYRRLLPPGLGRETDSCLPSIRRGRILRGSRSSSSRRTFVFVLLELGIRCVCTRLLRRSLGPFCSSSGADVCYRRVFLNRRLVCVSASRNLSHALVLEVGGDDKQQGRATIVAYYCPPNQEASRIARYFAGLATRLKWRENNGHNTILVGDSNGDRDTQGATRRSSGRSTTAAEALMAAEQQSGHCWLKPNNDGNCYTRFSISKASIDTTKGYDEANATSAVDHLSVGPNARVQCTIAEYRLNERMHLSADHVGLCFSLNIEINNSVPLS
jgi:hypothetical protein